MSKTLAPFGGRVDFDRSYIGLGSWIPKGTTVTASGIWVCALAVMNVKHGYSEPFLRSQ